MLDESESALPTLPLAASASALDVSSLKSIPRLTGSKDWVGWSKLILLTASNFGLLTPKTNKFSESAEHRPKALQLLLMTISFELVATVPDQSGPNAVYNYLKEEYGSPDVHSLRKTLKNVRMTGVEIQPFLQNFHAALSDLRSAGVSISIEDQIDVILDNINADFYLEAIRRIRQHCRQKSVLDANDLSFAKLTLRNFYDDTPAALRHAKPHSFNANAARVRSFSSSRYSGSPCQNCLENDRASIAKTHSTARCFWMTRPGWHAKSDAPASIQAIARSRLQSEEAAINGNSNYAHSKVFSRPKAQNCLVGARVLEPTKMRLKRSSNLRRLSSGIQYTRSITTPTSPNRVEKPEVPSGERSMRHQTSSHLSYVSKTGIYHDTGSTPISFFKDQPDNFQATPGSVQTADDSSSQSTGTGTIQFGNMTIPVVHVPSFNKNLASGIWIMTAGYYQEIYNNMLLVRTRPGGTIIATGTYNPSVGLLEMDAIVSLPLICPSLIGMLILNRQCHQNTLLLLPPQPLRSLGMTCIVQWVIQVQPCSHVHSRPLMEFLIV
jgi:hypothetical protein